MDGMRFGLPAENAAIEFNTTPKIGPIKHKKAAFYVKLKTRLAKN